MAIPGTVVFDAEESIARLTVPQLSPGFHRSVMDASAADVAGNTLLAPASWVLRVAAGMDADGDGLADSLEAALGLSPSDFDSDDDGIRAPSLCAGASLRRDMERGRRRRGTLRARP